MLVRIVSDCAPFRILPREGVGGCTPIPRKLNAASSSMEIANTDVAYTSTGAMVLGRISEKRIYRPGIPAVMSLLQKFVSRRESTLPRTSRVTPGQSTKPRIRIILHIPGLKMAAATSTSRIYGKDMTISVKLMMS